MFYLEKNEIRGKLGLKVMPKVKVDWAKCTGCGTYVDNCPVIVFELQDLLSYPNSKKAVTVRSNECVLCMICVTLCPTGAIIVEESSNACIGKTHFKVYALRFEEECSNG